MTFPIGRASTAEPDVRTGEAWAQWVHGKNEEAIRMFREAVNTWPDHIDANFGLGLSLKTAGQSPEAIECFNRVIALSDVELAKPMDDSSRFQMVRRMAQQHIRSLGS